MMRAQLFESGNSRHRRPALSSKIVVLKCRIGEVAAPVTAVVAIVWKCKGFELTV